MGLDHSRVRGRCKARYAAWAGVHRLPVEHADRPRALRVPAVLVRVGRGNNLRLLEDIADRYGTPIFVYDASTIRERLDTLREELDYRPLRVLYSAKANPAIGIVALMRDLGLGFDACSLGDLRLATLAGVPTKDISYTGFGSTDYELQVAAAQAGDLIVDSPGEIDRLSALEIRRPIGLRVNPGITAGFHEHVAAGARAAKFGVSPDAVAPLADYARAHGLPVVGLHAHIGSDVLDPAPHGLLLELMERLAASIAGLRWVNLGGGWGTPIAQRRPVPLVQRSRRRRPGICRGRHELRLEPGGHLIMDAGVLVGRVVAVKDGDEERLPTLITRTPTPTTFRASCSTERTTTSS